MKKSYGRNVKNSVPNKSTLLVTGGAGFIGSYIVDSLLAASHKVIIVDNLSTGKKENISPRAKFYNMDVSDEEALRTVFKRHEIDYVIHQAAKINLNVMLEYPALDVKSSVLGTLNLLMCCIDFRVKKFIYASSVAVYGRANKLPAAETDESASIYSYGIVKKCAEEYVKYYSNNYGLNYSILRYANVYGPRQPIFGEVGVIAIYTDQVIKGKPLIIYGDGSHLRDYIYIDDVVDVTLKVLNTGHRETFNVGCGVGVSVKEVFKHFCEASGKKLQYEHRPDRIGELERFYCDISKLRKTLQFVPKVSIKEGIFKTLSYYRDFPFRTISNDVSLRPVSKNDKRMIFEWRNIPYLISRGSSDNAVTWKEHCKWFDNLINTNITRLFIINFGGKPVGQVRFDSAEGNAYIVSIYLLEKYTGKGIGTAALKKGLELLSNKEANRIFVALIKADNKASKSVFSKAGFEEIKDYANLPPEHIAMKYTSGSNTHNTETLIIFYDKNVKKYKDEIKSVAWGSKKSQEKRFEMLSLIDNLEGKSILDIGCGVGDFYGWLKSRHINVRYTGIDITPSMIEVAKKKYPGIEFKIKNILESEEANPSYDYTFASGIFNLKISNHEQFVRDAITRMFSLSSLGMAFNIMSTKADFMEKEEYYGDAGEILNFCLSLSRKVVLRHEYMPHDFTVYVYKELK